MGEREEYAAYLEQQTLSKEYEQFLARKNYEKDMAQGGSIRKAPVDRFPIGSLAGGVVGGVAGGMVGGPTGAIIGGVGGAVLGEVGQQEYEKATGSEAAPKNIGEQIGGAAREGLFSLAGEGAGRVLVPTAQKVLRPFAKRVTPDAKEAITYLKGKGVVQPLLPKEATESHALDFLGNLAEGSIFGGGIIKDYKVNRDRILGKIADDLVDQFGQRTSKEDLGHLFEATVTGNLKTALAPSKVLYNNVSEATKPQMKVVFDPHTNSMKEVPQLPVSFSLKSAKEAVRSQSELAKALRGIEGEAAGDNLAKEIESLPDNVSYEEIKSLRSRLIAKADQMKIERRGAPAIGLTRRVIQQLHEEMDTKLKDWDPNVHSMWLEANAITAGSNKEFNSRLMRSLLRKGMEEYGANPEYIADAVLKPGASTRVRLVRKAVGEDVWQRFQSVAAEDIFKRAEMPGGQISGEKLQQVLTGRSGYGMAKLKEVFSPEQIDGFQRFANAMKVVQDRTSDASGKMLIQMTQGGAVLNLAANMTGLADTGLEATSGAILLGPAMLAKAMTNPKAVDWLIKGWQLPSGSTEAGVVGGHLLQALLPRKYMPDFPKSPPQDPHTPLRQSSVTPFQTDQAPQSSIPFTKEDIKAKVTKAAKDTKLDPKLFHAVVSTESNYNPMAISQAGAIGLTQLMPKTAAGMGVNPANVDENLKGGGQYLQSLIKKYDGNVAKALAAYNAGPGRVDKGGPLPQETQDYVAKVLLKAGGKRDKERR